MHRARPFAGIIALGRSGLRRLWGGGHVWARTQATRLPPMTSDRARPKNAKAHNDDKGKNDGGAFDHAAANPLPLVSIHLYSLESVGK